MPIRKSPTRSPLRSVKRVNAVGNLETDISSDADIELPSSESAPAPLQFGLRKFGVHDQKGNLQ